jgi:hypothetical protein
MRYSPTHHRIWIRGLAEDADTPDGSAKPDGLYMDVEQTKVMQMEWTVQTNWNQGSSERPDARGKGPDPGFG